MDPASLPPPPAYSEDANITEPTFRAAKFESPGERLTYRFNFQTDTIPLSVPFPTLWLTRDVEVQDWTTFLAYLPEPHGTLTKEGNFERYVDEVAWRRKISYVVAEWNKNFFGPRGLHVVPDLLIGTWPKKSQGSGTAN